MHDNTMSNYEFHPIGETFPLLDDDGLAAPSTRQTGTMARTTKQRAGDEAQDGQTREVVRHDDPAHVQRVEVVRTQHLVAHDTVVDCLGELTFEEWKELGWKLKFAERCCQWYLGWWWNNGHKKWGRDAERAAIEELGYKRATLQKYGEVYNRVKSRMRTRDLSFNHHQLVAYCQPSEQRDWLQKPKENGWSVSALRKAMRGAQPKPPLPEGTFDVLYTDPPGSMTTAALAAPPNSTTRR